DEIATSEPQQWGTHAWNKHLQPDLRRFQRVHFQRVARLQPNGLGLYDMFGNVSEVTYGEGETELLTGRWFGDVFAVRRKGGGASSPLATLQDLSSDWSSDNGEKGVRLILRPRKVVLR